MPKPWPVMLLVRDLGLGGSERQLTEIAKGLDRSRFEPHVGCFHCTGFNAAKLRSVGVPMVHIPVRSFHHYSTLSAGLLMGRYLRQHHIQLVHAFDLPMNLFAVPLARFFGVPTVLSSQRAHRELAAGVRRHLLRVTDQMADAVVVNSRFVLRHLVEDERVPADRVRLCYNGVDTSVFQPVAPSSPPAASDADMVIGTVAALRPEKGMDLLLEAFAQVRGLRPRTKLVITGNGPSLPSLKELARRLGLGDDCRFEEASAQVADCLRQIDIFVLPSLSESLSNSLMEAMACGCAVVASRVGGNPELVSDGETGLLFHPGDATDLAEKLRLLIEHDLLRRNLASAAVEFIHDGFSLQNAARLMGNIYDEFRTA